MESEANEDRAIEALDGAEWVGRQPKVNKAKPRKIIEMVVVLETNASKPY